MSRGDDAVGFDVEASYVSHRLNELLDGYLEVMTAAGACRLAAALRDHADRLEGLADECRESEVDTATEFRRIGGDRRRDAR